jgi:hypothetical protein
LLLGFCCSYAVASSNICSDCNQVYDVSDEMSSPALPSPSLNIDVLDAVADVAVPADETTAENIVSPVLAEDVEDDGEADDRSSGPVTGPPETALHLPGVAEEDQPRFRRQMYRTDI